MSYCRAEWTLRLSKFEHLSTPTKDDDDARLDDERFGLFNGSKEEGSSLSDTDDDLNSSKHDELSDDSTLSDDAILASRARLPSESSTDDISLYIILFYSFSSTIAKLKAFE